ncbi:MAG TPA: endonuclease III [Clostridia bacterium]|nr:endonuclease III [Clostridia bacterium]
MTNDKDKTDKILELMEKEYGGAGPELLHGNPFELLIATILSAQCTDKQVNKVTPSLFEKYPTPWDMAGVETEEMERHIRSCGFYKTKSRNILMTCNILVEKYGGKVPEDIETLMTLPGVGRKTANVVASNAFGVDAIAVDTHVFRVSNRLGLAHAKNVLDTEKQLMANIPQEKWTPAHLWLIYHGRRVCNARSPKCDICFLSPYCVYYQSTNDQ